MYIYTCKCILSGIHRDAMGSLSPLGRMQPTTPRGIFESVTTPPKQSKISMSAQISPPSISSIMH